MSKTENYLQTWVNNDQLADLKAFCKRNNLTIYEFIKNSILEKMYPNGQKQSRLGPIPKKSSKGK